MADQIRDQDGSVQSKREYESPRIVWEEDFEPTSYAKCGRLPGGASQACMMNPGS